MNKYTLRYNNSRSDRSVTSVQEGLDLLRKDYPELVHTTDVDRVIVWEDEASSENDDGRRAVAEITWPARD